MKMWNGVFARALGAVVRRTRAARVSSDIDVPGSTFVGRCAMSEDVEAGRLIEEEEEKEEEEEEEEEDERGG